MFFFYFSVALVFLFIFTTGFHDESNLIATIVTSRSVNTYVIFVLSAVSQFLGTLFLGTKVAYSMMKNTLNVEYVLNSAQSKEILYLITSSAMLGAILWNIITWLFGIPSSSSHALIGALIGPFLIHFGVQALYPVGLLLSVVLPLFTSPVIGFILGFVFLKINKFFSRFSGIYINRFFKSFQIVTCVFINAFQGSNDAQKGMGVLAFLLMLEMQKPDLFIMQPVVFLSALAISLGLAMGGLKMIRSVGVKIFRVRSIHSISAQSSSLLVIVLASLLGFPVSGTQIVNSSTLGVGAAERPNAVGWNYAKNMLMGWFITIPASALISSGLYLLLKCMAYGGKL